MKKRENREKHLKSAISGLLVLALIAVLAFSYALPSTRAKTVASATAERVFFYAQNDAGQSVLLKVVEMEDLVAVEHGQLDGNGDDTGVNYRYSYTDNLPTTGYGEARGLTLPEFVDYVKSVSPVAGAETLTYTGGDALGLMATDSRGFYTKNWTYDTLYGVARYYIPAMLDPLVGWNTGWEIAGENEDGEDIAQKGLGLDTYYNVYRANDAFAADKDAAFATAQLMVPILATTSYAGRTSSDADLTSEIGIADLIEANGGVVTGSLADIMETDAARPFSLRFELPMTEADLYAGHRTAFDNFKWVYNLRLTMESAPHIVSAGSIPAPTSHVTLSEDGNTAYITMATVAGAQVYYSYTISDDPNDSAGAPQYRYDGPVAVDVTGRDLSANPLYYYMTAVREGYTDAGIVTVSYPAQMPVFSTAHSIAYGAGLTGSAAVNTAFTDWADAQPDISVKAPAATGFTPLTAGQLTVNRELGTFTIASSVFTATGSYSFLIQADGYARRQFSVTVLAPPNAFPELNVDDVYYLNNLRASGLVISSANNAFQSGATVKINGQQLLPSSVNTATAGKITIRQSYFNNSGNTGSTAGTYTIEVTNTSFTPTSRIYTVDFVEGDAPSFAFTLARATSGELRSGDTVPLTLSLEADGAFTFYGAQYAFAFDTAKFTLDTATITTESGWQYGTATVGTIKYVTFTRLDGADGTAGASGAIAAFSLTIKGRGDATLTPDTHILTDANAKSRGYVTANTLTLTVAGSAAGDVDGDGLITVKDLTMLQQVLANLLPSGYIGNADVDEDGNVTVKDAIKLMQILAGLE